MSRAWRTVLLTMLQGRPSTRPGHPCVMKCFALQGTGLVARDLAALAVWRVLRCTGMRAGSPPSPLPCPAPTAALDAGTITPSTGRTFGAAKISPPNSAADHAALANAAHPWTVVCHSLQAQGA